MRTRPEERALGIVLAAILIIAVLAIVGCARGPIPERLAPAPGVKPVAMLWDSPGEFAWRRSGFLRAEDSMTTPWRIVLSADGTACPVWEHELIVPKRGDPYKCSSSWRVRRP